MLILAMVVVDACWLSGRGWLPLVGFGRWGADKGYPVTFPWMTDKQHRKLMHSTIGLMSQNAGEILECANKMLC